MEQLAMHKATDPEGLSDETCDSDSTWSESGSNVSDDGSSDMSCTSDASVEESGLIPVDMTFRIRCLHEDLELWLARWGGVENWQRMALDPERYVEVRAQMALGVHYAELLGEVWNAKVCKNDEETI